MYLFRRGCPFIFLVVGPLTVACTNTSDISTARGEAVGTVVTVHGTVTVPTNAFDTGFAIQQDDAGIYVADSAGVSHSIGDLVTVTGKLADQSGLLAIQPTTITSEGNGASMVSHHVATADVGEATEGRLLHLKGSMADALVDDSPYGFKFPIDDGSGPVQIFLYPGAVTSTTGLAVGATIELDCFSNQYETHYECDPPNADSFHVSP